ncbi:MAG: T9SS type A sorting domain-containing protein [Fibrobacteres bacterium]|nr:T9SS type A sorting domain-containing protein [Fibrobacterota bacterium]
MKILLSLLLLAVYVLPDVTTDFVWPVFFNENKADSVDITKFVPGYAAGTTTITLRAVSSTGLSDSVNLPSNISFDGKYFRYDGTAKQEPWAWGAFRLISLNPAWISNKFNVVVGPEPTWIAGNGNWDYGTNGAGSFDTLKKIVAALPDSGGWAEIPNTRIDYVMNSSAFGNSLRIWMRNNISKGNALTGNSGADNILNIWGSAAFNGRSFLIGAVGGHYAAWSNQFLKIRFTDPPAVSMLHIPFAAGAALNRGEQVATAPYGNPGGALAWKPPYAWGGWNSAAGTWSDPDYFWERVSPVWGPGATHQYNSFKYCAANDKYLMGGSNQWYCVDDNKMAGIMWEIDLNASTPREAFRPIGMEELRSANHKATGFGVEKMVELENGDIAFMDWSGTPFKYRHSTRDAVLFTGDTLMNNDARFGWRNPYSSKYYGFTRTTNNLPALYCLSTRSQVALLPSWTQGNLLDEAAGIAFPDSNSAVLYNGQFSRNVCRVNLKTGVVTEFVSSTGPLGQSQAGQWDKFAYIPEANCFVAIVAINQNAWLFKPPSGWNASGGSTEGELTNTKTSLATITAYPMPFNPIVNINIAGARKLDHIVIYNVTGAPVAKLSSKTNVFQWNATKMPAGVYIASCNIEDRKYAKRIYLAK